MNTYKVSGESRQVGAIGIMEPFNVNIISHCAKCAYDETRNKLYSENREHVHIKQNGIVVSPIDYI